MGFEGFPERIWFLVEAFSEITGLVDFGLRLTLKLVFPEIWKEMNLLHDFNIKSWFTVIIRFIATIPSSLIIAHIFKNNQTVRFSFWIACLRLLKLVRFRQFCTYFDTVGNSSKGIIWLLKVVEVVYNFLLATNFMAMAWIIAGRLSGTAGWFTLAKYF